MAKFVDEISHGYLVHICWVYNNGYRFGGHLFRYVGEWVRYLGAERTTVVS